MSSVVFIRISGTQIQRIKRAKQAKISTKKGFFFLKSKKITDNILAKFVER